MTDEEVEQRRKNAERQKQWRAKNRDRALEINRKSDRKARAERPEEIRVRAKTRKAAWRATNPERVRAADRKWRRENPAKARAKTRVFRAAHPEKVAAANASYSVTKKARRQSDPAWAQTQRDRTAQWAKDNPEKIVEKYKARRANCALHDQLVNVRNRARKAGLPFDEALFNIVDNPPKNCEACGAPFATVDPVRGQGRRINLRALSIDRVDNAKGYLVSNVGYICFACNAIKKDATADKLEAIAAYIRRRSARPPSPPL